MVKTVSFFIVKLSVPRIGYKDKIAQIRRTIIWNEYGSITIYFFSTCFAGQLANSHHLWYCRTYVVARRLVFISGGITHASFGGLGLGFYLGTNPILMAMVFSVLSAFGVEWASKTQDVREIRQLPVFGRFGMALGVTFYISYSRLCSQSVCLLYSVIS